MVKNRLLDIRLKLGYKKQKDFADFLGIAQTKYNKYENNINQPNTETVLKISSKLNMKLEEIIYLEDS